MFGRWFLEFWSDDDGLNWISVVSTINGVLMTLHPHEVDKAHGMVNWRNAAANYALEVLAA